MMILCVFGFFFSVSCAPKTIWLIFVAVLVGFFWSSLDISLKLIGQDYISLFFSLLLFSSPHHPSLQFARS